MKEISKMENNLRHILSLIGNEKEQETALAYVEGTLEAEEKTAFENRLRQDPFLQDALEGLASIDRTKLPRIREELSRHITAQVRKKRKERKSASPGTWVYAALILILLLALISFWVISKLKS